MDKKARHHSKQTYKSNLHFPVFCRSRFAFVQLNILSRFPYSASLIFSLSYYTLKRIQNHYQP